MDEIFSSLLAQWQQQSLLEIAAVLFSMLYPWLAARQNILCWPAALLSTSLYAYVFWESNLPFNSVLNVYYLVMAVYGWVRWSKDDSGKTLAVSTLPLIYHIVAVPVLLISGFTLSHLVTFSWAGTDLYLDAMVTVFSVYATFLMANKVLENWLFWIVINGFACYLYFTNGLFLTGVLFIGYFIFAFYGYCHWKRDYKTQGAPEQQLV
ncbi:nicotinamide riboside transporter PnuC [Aliiglaciecola sp. M165]|uniref:nicotinamide riboside transporter PnuC n=1 Tax=Aliiglaciecola sp. M165 TaxID=2593649 RepID=UPI001180E2E5|nr:nicotinamide riboside transporter PnuC [Aliiglaciecola sp. M165]TRY29441.1 nicotinamide mononucleotide transporter [Aliiglaciecola sp. M165]